MRELLENLDEQTQKEVARQLSDLKKVLKQHSKNELIQLLIQQVAINVQNQNINKVLLEKNKELAMPGNEEVK